MRFLISCIAFLTFAFQAQAQVNVGFGGEAHNASAPVELSADSLSFDQSSGQATASGNVVIVQGNLRLAAGQVVVTYQDNASGQRVSQVTASGGVLVTRGEDAAEGDRAEYAVRDAELSILGNVLITQGPAAISGDRLTIDMETGAGTISGRVRTVLQGDDP